MKKLFEKNKLVVSIFILLALFIVAAAPRLWMLNDIPISFSDDEVRQIYTSYSVAVSGKDIFGNFLPLTFLIDGYAYGPMSLYFPALFFLLFDLPATFGRIAFAFSGILSVILVYFLVKELVKNRAAAVISSLVMSISVWHVQMSRLAHEGGIALFFYLIGINLFLRIKKGDILYTVFTMLVMFVAFYTYSATRVIYLPFMLILIWYKFRDFSKKQLLIIISFVIFTLASFGFLAITQGAADYSTKPLFFLDIDKASHEVEMRRRGSNAPEFLENIYHNKLTYWHRTFTKQYSYAFSPEFLFTSQEASGIYSTWGRGYLYSFEIVFILFGLYFLFTKKNRAAIFVFLMLLAAPLPSGLGGSNPTYFVRSALMVPFLYSIIGLGIFAIFSYVKNKKIGLLFLALVLLIYAYSFGGYLAQYYYDWSKNNARYYSKSTKDLVYMLNEEKNKKDKIIVAGGGQNLLLHYALYNNLEPGVVHKLLAVEGPITIDNITIQWECIKGDPVEDIENRSLYITRPDCHLKNEPHDVIRTYDHHQEVIWKIYTKD